MNRTLLIVAFAILLSFPALGADRVELTNGDRLTGTLVRSDAKAFTFKLDMAGEVSVPWSAVERLTSEQTRVLLLQDGRAVVGQVSFSNGEFEIRRTEGEPFKVAAAQLRSIRSEEEHKIEEQKRERLKHPGWGDFWHGSIDSGLSVTGGNSETLTLSSGVNLGRTTRNDRLSTYLTLLFAENSTTGVTLRTANAVRGGVRYDRNINRRVFGFGFTELETDEFKELDLRTVFGGGLGWYAAKSPKLRLSLISGFSFNREDFSTGISRRSGEGLVGQELAYQISSHLELIERSVFYANLSNTGEYRSTLDGSVVTKINERFRWHITFSDRFLSNPALGAKRNDLLVTTGLRVTFGRESPVKFEAQMPDAVKIE